MGALFFVITLGNATKPHKTSRRSHKDEFSLHDLTQLCYYVFSVRNDKSVK